MNSKDYIIKLQRQITVLQNLLEECQTAAINRENKAEKCFTSKEDLQLEIRALQTRILSLINK